METTETTVESIMIKDVEEVRPSTTVAEVSQKMLDKHVRCVPVCDEEGKLQGLVTDSDIVFRTTGKDNPLDIPVEEIMTKNLIWVKPSTDIYQVVALMGKHGFRRMPIVDGDKLVGIVSVRDIVRKMLRDLHAVHKNSQEP